MGSSVSFYSSRADVQELTAYAKSLGLFVAPLAAAQIVDEDDPANGPVCQLSLVPVERLTRYGSKPVKLGHPTDPLIEFWRGYYDPPYLVSGRLYWYNDDKNVGRLTKPAFTKLARWIRGNWQKRPGSAFYFGREAYRLADEGAIPTTFKPGLVVEQVIVPSSPEE